MRLLFIRHGDPDYEHDTLTEKGHREAQALSDYIEHWKIGTAFMSPLGRAQHTAEYSLRKLGITAETFSWLQEFPAQVDVNDSAELQAAYPDTQMSENEGQYRTRIAWDMMPDYLSRHPEYLTLDGWRNSEVASHSNLEQIFEEVVTAFDQFLAERGYVKEKGYYRVEKESEETYTFFCHFGLTCVLLSRLWNVSPFVLWHTLAMAPTSVTEVVTEEREAGKAIFRATKIGDITHLNLAGEPASFAARFCETYSNMEQRH